MRRNLITAVQIILALPTALNGNLQNAPIIGVCHNRTLNEAKVGRLNLLRLEHAGRRSRWTHIAVLNLHLVH